MYRKEAVLVLRKDPGQAPDGAFRDDVGVYGGAFRDDGGGSGFPVANLISAAPDSI